MADSDGSLINYEGKTWSIWAENLGFSSPSSDPDEEDGGKVQRDACSMRLRKEEMPIYGICPGIEEFYLVVCNTCHKVVKPQAFEDHIALQHAGLSGPYKPTSTKIVNTHIHKSSKSRKNKSSVKHERKVDISETYRDNTVSAEQNSVHSNKYNNRLAVDFKASMFTAEECNTNFSNSIGVQKNRLGMNFLSMKQELDPLLKLNQKAETIEEVSNHIPHSYLAPPVPPDSHVYQASPSPSSMQQQISLTQNPIGAPLTPGICSPMLGMSPLTPNIGPPTPGLGRPPTPGMGRPTTPGMGRPLTPGLGRPITPGMGPPTPGMGPPTPGVGPMTPGMGPSTPGMSPSPGLQGMQSIPAGSMGTNQSPSMGHQTPTHVPIPSISPYTQSPSPAQSNQSYHQNVNSLQSTSSQQQFNQLLQSPSQNIRQVTNLASLLQNVESSSQNVGVQISQANYGLIGRRGNLSQNLMQSVAVASCVPQQGQIRSKNRLMTSIDEEEEVNKISAMLMKETENMTVPHPVEMNLCMSSISVPQTIVEAQGQAGGGMRRTQMVAHQIGKPSSINPNICHGQRSNLQRIPRTHQTSTVPVPMDSHINMQALKQIQDELLEAVSESDLNAVLNSTPDTSLLNNSNFVTNNSHIQFSEPSIPAESQFISPEVSNQTNTLYRSDAITLPSLDDLTNDILMDNTQSQVSSDMHKVFSRPQDSGDGSNSSLLFNLEKTSQNDELARAVDSITHIYQDNSNSSSYSLLTGLLQQSSGPTSSTVTLTPSSANTPSRPHSNQGITVVIGDPNSSSTPLTLNSLRKPVLSLSSSHGQQLNHDTIAAGSILQRSVSGEMLRKETRPLSQDNFSNSSVEQDSNPTTHVQPHINAQVKVQQVQISQQNRHQFEQTSPATQNFANSSSGSLLSNPSVSPKKPSKRRKSERKFVPLKDREYDPEIHCGVIVAETGRPCTRSLTCKSHSLTLRRNVQARSKKFDDLLSEHKAAKGAPARPAKPAETITTNLYQSTSPRAQVVLNNSNIGTYTTVNAHGISHIGSSSAPILVRTLSGGSNPPCVTLPDPSPTAQSHYPDANISSMSPNNWSHQRLTSPVSPVDEFFVNDPPKPITVCRYGGRKFGGHFQTDHKGDLFRNTFRSCLKRPTLGSLLSDSCSSSSIQYNTVPADRYNNVKPLLARKLQSTGPTVTSSSNKELIAATVGYNGHIQLSNNSLTMNNSTLAAALKRPINAELVRNNISAKHKSKKIKACDGAINYVGNVVQLDPNSAKGQYPMVAVSLANGLNSPQTITLGNVMAGVRNSPNQSIRIHSSVTMKDAQNVDNRSTLGDNIVLGSGLPGTGFVIADTLKPLKQEVGSSLRIEGQKIITTSKGTPVGSTAGTSISLVGSTNNIPGGTSTVLTQAVPHQGQYILTAVPGSTNTQFIQQLRNCRMGRTSGVKLLGTNAGNVGGGRQAFVLQQEKEPS